MPNPLPFPDELVHAGTARLPFPIPLLYLLAVNSPRLNPTPNWKGLILSTPEWPDDLVVPQTDSLAEDSELVMDSMATKENWEWELWRDPDGHSYYLKIWPMGESDLDNPSTPGVELTVMETFQFLFTNWLPREVTADLICDHRDLLKPFGFPITTPGLN